MNTRRFITFQPVIANRATLTGDELHHLKNVNRAKPGDPVEVIDGRGSLFFGTVHTIDNREAVITVTGEEKQPKPPGSVTIAPSLTKRKGMSVMMEKLAELGVDEIRPVICVRTDEAFNPSMLKKWRAVALQTLKVTKRLWSTAIFPPVPLWELAETTAAGTKIMLDAEGVSGMPGDIAPPVTAVIGPPGGFVRDEREWLTNREFLPVKINTGVLKTETAALSAAAILMADGLNTGR